MMSFKPNVGKTDRIIRAVAGVGLFSMFFILEGPAHWFGLIGIVPLFTAAVRFCPAYTLVRMNTCSAGDKMGKCCGGGCHTKAEEDKPEDEKKDAA